jgi:hypothetical protein
MWRRLAYPSRQVRAFARHRTLACLACAAAVVALRLALLGWVPIPSPAYHDEYSNLLGASTFAHGRLANPAPRAPEAFQSPHVLTRPAYAPKYPPGQALALAAGQTLFGHPYWGVLLSVAAMSGLACWMVQGWAPPGWGLVAGTLVLAFFGTASYWVQSYWGGAVGACGAELVIGSAGRMLRGRRFGSSLWLGFGALLLALTRPWEGAPLVMAALACGARDALRLPPEQRKQAVRRLALGCVPGLIGFVAIQGAVNRAVTGEFLSLPYAVYMRQYHAVPALWVQPLRPEPAYPNAEMRQVHGLNGFEARSYYEIHNLPWGSRAAYLWRRVWRAGVEWWLGGLAGALVFSFFAWPVRAMRRILLLVAAAIAPLLVEVWMYSHYTVGLLAGVLLLATWMLRWAGTAPARGRPGGALLAPLLAAILTIGLWRTAIAGPAHLQPGSIGELGVSRERLAEKLTRSGARHLVFVGDRAEGCPWDAEWVYNGADLEGALVLFAHARRPEEDRRVAEAYPGRKLWRVTFAPSASSPCTPQVRPYEPAASAEASGRALPFPGRHSLP